MYSVFPSPLLNSKWSMYQILSCCQSLSLSSVLSGPKRQYRRRHILSPVVVVTVFPYFRLPVSFVPYRAITLDNQLVVLATTAADAGRYHVEAINEMTGENVTSPAIYLSVSGKKKKTFCLNIKALGCSFGSILTWCSPSMSVTLSQQWIKPCSILKPHQEAVRCIIRYDWLWIIRFLDSLRNCYLLIIWFYLTFLTLWGELDWTLCVEWIQLYRWTRRFNWNLHYLLSWEGKRQFEWHPNYCWQAEYKTWKWDEQPRIWNVD